MRDIKLFSKFFTGICISVKFYYLSHVLGFKKLTSEKAIDISFLLYRDL